MSTGDPKANLSVGLSLTAIAAVVGMLVFTLVGGEPQQWSWFRTLVLYILIFTLLGAPLLAFAFAVSALRDVDSSYQPRTVRRRAIFGLVLSLISMLSCGVVVIVGNLLRE
jgi:hypothetical protein